jgi:hypothetical protein
MTKAQSIKEHEETGDSTQQLTWVQASLQQPGRGSSLLQTHTACCSTPPMHLWLAWKHGHPSTPHLPGSFMSNARPPRRDSVLRSIASPGTKVAPICWVIPPASPSWTLVRRMLSKICRSLDHHMCMQVCVNGIECREDGWCRDQPH